MASSPLQRMRRFWAGLPLRVRLILYFVLVSVPPVLVASFVAAQVISGAFERNVEQWIGELARFMASEAAEGLEEASRATAIVAASLSHAGAGAGDPSIEPFAELLTSVGYDFVALYTEQGEVLFSTGQIELRQPLPKEAVSSIFFGQRDGAPLLMVGAAQPVAIGTRKAFLFVGDVLDEQFFTAPHSISSLDLHLMWVAPDGQLVDLARNSRRPLAVPPEALAQLKAGAEMAAAAGGPAIALAALRDDHGRLVGIIGCRLKGATAAVERLGTVWLFLALAAIAGLLSLLVGVSLARRLSAPLRELTLAVRAVADGDYKVRVREEGGRELEELACGFNTMAMQLETLRDMESEMRQRAQLATLGEAAAVIAHEIRNPLGIIKTSAELVRRKAPMAPGEDRLMMFVLDEVNRIERLVQDLLDYARPSACVAAPLELVEEVVRPVLDFVRPEAARRGISLTSRLPEGPVPILGDADHLHQALLNLLLNAMDAAGPSGHIIVRIALDGEGVTIAVEDSGPGLPAELRDRLFEPFVTTKTNGTGLGLAKVQATVKAHKGEVSAADAPGGGALFVVRLPLRSPSE